MIAYRIFFYPSSFFRFLYLFTVYPLSLMCDMGSGLRLACTSIFLSSYIIKNAGPPAICSCHLVFSRIYEKPSISTQMPLLPCKEAIELMNKASNSLPNRHPNHYHAKSSFQTLVGSCMTTTHP